MFPDLHIAPAGSGHEPPPLVVEIATPFNRGLCSTLYPVLYAAAGIRRFWRVDLEPRFAIVAHELDVESKRYMSAPPPVFR